MSSKGVGLPGLLLSLERKLFRGSETAERLYIMNERRENVPMDKRLRFLINRHTYKIARAEARLLDLSKPSAAVMVGCGIFPATLLFLAENTKIPRLVGIDQDPEVVELAETLISHTGHRISFACCQGDKFDFSGFDLVYIANGTVGKAGVLAVTAADCPSNSEIIARIPFGPGRLFYEDLDSEPPPPLRKIQLGKPDLLFLNRVVVYKKTV